MKLIKIDIFKVIMMKMMKKIQNIMNLKIYQKILLNISQEMIFKKI